MTRGMHGEFPAGMWAAVFTGPSLVPLCKGGSGRRVGARPIGVGRSAPGAFLRKHIAIYRGKGCNISAITDGISGKVCYGVYGVLLANEFGRMESSAGRGVLCFMSFLMGA